MGGSPATTIAGVLIFRAFQAPRRDPRRWRAAGRLVLGAPNPAAGRGHRARWGGAAMRVLHITDTYLPQAGGIELHVDGLARRQRTLGLDAVWTCPRSAPAASPDPGWVQRLGGHGLTRPGRSVAAAREVVDLIRASRCDIVHAHASVVSPMAFCAARSRHSRIDPDGGERAFPLVGPRAAAKHRGLDLEAAPAWPVASWSVSSLAAASVAQTLGGDVLVSGSFQERRRLDTGLPRGSARLGELTIACVMRLARRKRAMPLLRMLRRLRREAPGGLRFRVLIVGDGAERQAMERFLRLHGMDDWVHLLGRLDRAEIRRTIFEGAHFFVAPAEMESFGIAALEARCSGLPVIASARGGVGEFIQHGVDGFLTRSDAEMVRAMLTLLTEHDVRARIAAHNASVRPGATWEAVLQSTAKVYERAATLVGVHDALSVVFA